MKKKFYLLLLVVLYVVLFAMPLSYCGITLTNFSQSNPQYSELELLNICSNLIYNSDFVNLPYNSSNNTQSTIRNDILNYCTNNTYSYVFYNLIYDSTISSHNPNKCTIYFSNNGFSSGTYYVKTFSKTSNSSYFGFTSGQYSGSYSVNGDISSNGQIKDKFLFNNGVSYVSIQNNHSIAPPLTFISVVGTTITIDGINYKNVNAGRDLLNWGIGSLRNVDYYTNVSYLVEQFNGTTWESCNPIYFRYNSYGLYEVGFLSYLTYYNQAYRVKFTSNEMNTDYFYYIFSPVRLYC